MSRFRFFYLLIAITLRAGTGFAMPGACDAPQAACDRKCGQLRIYDNGSGEYLKQSDFKARCDKACSAGTASCNVQDSADACNTFFYHCLAACPFTVVDTYEDVTVPDTNSFQQCRESCSSGSMVCRSPDAKVPPRTRTGKFDACEEAQGACYSVCMSALPEDVNGRSMVDDPEFPDKCAAACAKGVPGCKAAGVQTRCKKFLEQCRPACPAVTQADTDRYHRELDEEFDEFSTGSLCGDACDEGSSWCEQILGSKP